MAIFENITEAIESKAIEGSKRCSERRRFRIKVIKRQLSHFLSEEYKSLVNLIDKMKSNANCDLSDISVKECFIRLLNSYEWEFNRAIYRIARIETVYNLSNSEVFISKEFEKMLETKVKERVNKFYMLEEEVEEEVAFKILLAVHKASVIDMIVTVICDHYADESVGFLQEDRVEEVLIDICEQVMKSTIEDAYPNNDKHSLRMAFYLVTLLGFEIANFSFEEEVFIAYIDDSDHIDTISKLYK